MVTVKSNKRKKAPFNNGDMVTKGFVAGGNPFTTGPGSTRRKRPIIKKK